MSKTRNILLVESSLRADNLSFSRRATADLVSTLRRTHPNCAVVTRDLAHDPLDHIDSSFVDAISISQDIRSPQQVEALRCSENLIQELEAADTVIISCPMYNYSVPSSVKAWIDHIVRAGRTFVHTPDGPKGLLQDRPVYLVVSAGGVYSEGNGTSYDFCAPYVRTVLGKIGLKSVEVVYVDGLALGTTAADKAIAKSRARIDQLFSTFAEKRVGHNA